MRENLRGLACGDERQQERDLAVSGRDIWKGEYGNVVLSLADLLYGLCGIVRIRGRRYVGCMPLSLRKVIE
jgi:hypothetical protein